MATGRRLSAVAAAAPWDAQEPGVQYMFALTDGRLLHTTRNTAGSKASNKKAPVKPALLIINR